MKVLHLNGADLEGGAAKAATRLLRGIRPLGVDARLYVQRRSGNDPLVDGPGMLVGRAFAHARPTIEQLIAGINPARLNGPFCAAFLPDGLFSRISGSSPDIIHLHWVARMMRLETLGRFNLPIVWTLHDSWPFTGGCYLPGGCTRYRESCGACPVLNSTMEDDLSRRVWERKRKAWQGLDLTVVAPSRWIGECAKASSLFRTRRVAVIPNGLDTSIYKPGEKRAARKAFSLPQNRKLVLYGAKAGLHDRNKGFHLLAAALPELAGTLERDSVELVIFGSPEPVPRPDLGLRAHYLGWQGDSRLAQLYVAADLFVLPSVQENLPYTVMEAMACGTPSVAFRQGGVPDLIDHGLNGYLAEPHDPGDLARGIAIALKDDGLREEWSVQARHKVEREFAMEKIAARHLTLYREMVNHER